MTSTPILAVQLWFGFDAVSSPSSVTTGNTPPAVMPPVEDENSVRATAPVDVRRILPAVSLIARFVRLSSATVEPLIVWLIPAYTWQVVVSHVLATPG